VRPSPEAGLEPEGERMSAVQHLLAFARPLAARVRSVRRPFRPSPGEGGYRLPHDLRDRLTAALAPFRNREAAYALAVFLARFWSVPGRVAGSFPIDRRELADRPDLGLTEKRVRSAITTLEAVGFLDRGIAPTGSRYKATEDGLRRKPILFMFGTEYAPLFLAANKRVRAARGCDQRARRVLQPSAPSRLSVAISEARALKGPKSKSGTDPTVLMGPLRQESGLPAEPSTPSALELALQRLEEGVFGSPRVGHDGGK
jgi:hypothetical protein